MAGMETTVTTLKWGLLYMVHYPEVRDERRRSVERESNRRRTGTRALSPRDSHRSSEAQRLTDDGRPRPFTVYLRNNH